jgi:hypothetical protein
VVCFEKDLRCCISAVARQMEHRKKRVSNAKSVPDAEKRFKTKKMVHWLRERESGNGIGIRVGQKVIWHSITSPAVRLLQAQRRASQ